MTQTEKNKANKTGTAALAVSVLLYDENHSLGEWFEKA